MDKQRGSSYSRTPLAPGSAEPLRVQRRESSISEEEVVVDEDSSFEPASVYFGRVDLSAGDLVGSQSRDGYTPSQPKRVAKSARPVQSMYVSSTSRKSDVPRTSIGGQRIQRRTPVSRRTEPRIMRSRQKDSTSDDEQPSISLTTSSITPGSSSRLLHPKRRPVRRSAASSERKQVPVATKPVRRTYGSSSSGMSQPSVAQTQSMYVHRRDSKAVPRKSMGPHRTSQGSKGPSSSSSKGASRAASPSHSTHSTASSRRRVKPNSRPAARSRDGSLRRIPSIKGGQLSLPAWR